jgi:hypothetical protein
MGGGEGCCGLCKGVQLVNGNASKGPRFKDAQFLHVSPKQVMVAMLNAFCIQDLVERYECITSYLQHILKTIIGEKGGMQKRKRSRNSDHVSPANMIFKIYIVLMHSWGRTMITSTILNLHS